MKDLFAILFLSIMLSSVSYAQQQQVLTADDAVGIALKNNYDILVAHNDAEIAKANNTLGNAGMLPTVAITGSDNYSQNNVKQKPASGGDLLYPNARSNALNAGAELDWTLFDGGKMFVTKRKLSDIEVLGKIGLRDKVLQTAYSVITAYYDVVRQKQQLASINEVITYNQERVTILQTSFDVGLSPKTDLLQAEIDLNVNKENFINQQTVISVAKRTLNQLMSRNADAAFDVTDSIPLNYVPDKDQLVKKLYSNNTAVLSSQKQVDIARLSVQEIGTLRFPKITLHAGYDVSQSDNSIGTTFMNRALGPQVGGTISIPLYQSGNISRQILTAKLQLQSAEYSLENEKLQVNSQLQNALDAFNNQRQLLTIEKNNAVRAKENLEISMQRLRLGHSTSLELRQAQSSYEESLTRLIDIKYTLKVAETKLKQLMSEIE